MRFSLTALRLARAKLRLFIGAAAVFTAGAQAPRLTPERLQDLLKRYPDADANRDGVLTEVEARAYEAKLRAQRSPAAPRAAVAPEPSLANVAYGPAPRNVLDFWRAAADQPTPVVIYIHGGGFINGDKARARGEKLVAQCLEAGVSFAAINYRYLSPETPIQDVLRDCARAVQFIRARAVAWNVDRARLAAYGGSAGAGASLWLAFHDDLADPKNADPVLRESTRLVCAGAMLPQASYDMLRWDDLVGAANVQKFGGHYNSPAIYGLGSPADLRGPAGQKIRADCDMLGLISKDDPPVFISTSLPDLTLTNTNEFLHHPRHAQALYERCREVGVPVVASVAAVKLAPPQGGPATWRDFLFSCLKVK